MFNDADVRPGDSMARIAVASENAAMESRHVRQALEYRRLRKNIDAGVFWGGFKLFLVILLLSPIWALLFVVFWTVMWTTVGAAIVAWFATLGGAGQPPTWP